MKNTELVKTNKKENVIKYAHIAIIVLGAIFISLSIFHSNLWFDESYSVDIAKHSFSEIWTIGSHDVHPILYYFILHIVGMITNYNLIALRMVSLVSLILVGVLGYTHIRKDFGEKTGILFSFLVFFLPVTAEYAGELRMYSLGMLLGTILGIYAFRLYKGKESTKNFIIFGLSSLSVAYTHYYGLMLAGIINLLLFIYYIKNRKTRGKALKKFITTAVIQVALYLPWLFIFLGQLKSVSKGFWITLTFPETLIEILNMQFVGTLPSTVGLIFAIAVFLYLIYICIFKIGKQKEKIDMKPAIISILVYVGIILVAFGISLCMQSILLYRYLLILTGIFIFGISYIIAKDDNKYRVAILCGVILIVSLFSNIGLINENYDSRNNAFLSYLNQNVKEDDIILYSDAISGAVVTTYFGDNQSYFYDKNHWNVEEAYKAYAPSMKIIYGIDDLLKEYKGRIVLVEGGDSSSLLDEIEEKNNNCNNISREVFETGYKNNTYTIEIIELNKIVEENVNEK